MIMCTLFWCLFCLCVCCLAQTLRRCLSTRACWTRTTVCATCLLCLTCRASNKMKSKDVAVLILSDNKTAMVDRQVLNQLENLVLTRRAKHSKSGWMERNSQTLQNFLDCTTRTTTLKSSRIVRKRSSSRIPMWDFVEKLPHNTFV